MAKTAASRWLLALVALAGSSPELASPAALSVQVLARRMAPGEPVRILVTSAVPLAALEGTFLGQSLFFTREPAASFCAWSLVGLDHAPGEGTLDLRGRTLEGAPLHTTRKVRVLRVKFPVQRLEVESKYVTPPPEVTERLARERERLARVYAERSADAAPALPFVRPVPGEATSTFGAQRILNGEKRDPHPGLDLHAATGTPVLASGPGRVEIAEDLYYSGGTVILDHGGGLFTVYAHLSRIDVHAQDRVKAGDVLGASGATGRVTGPHLHWGAKVGDKPFDPAALLDPALFPASVVR